MICVSLVKLACLRRMQIPLKDEKVGRRYLVALSVVADPYP